MSMPSTIAYSRPLVRIGVGKPSLTCSGWPIALSPLNRAIGEVDDRNTDLNSGVVGLHHRPVPEQLIWERPLLKPILGMRLGEHVLQRFSQFLAQFLDH